jgi:hypothetical protein
MYRFLSFESTPHVLDMVNGDKLNSQPMATRPREVDWAVRLLWISLAITLLVSPLDWHYSKGAESLPGLLVNDLFIFGFESFLIWKISQGTNWARITFLVLSLLGLALAIGLVAIFHPKIPSPVPVVSWVISGLQSLIQAAALLLLFREPARYWFKGPPRIIRLASEQR